MAIYGDPPVGNFARRPTGHFTDWQFQVHIVVSRVENWLFGPPTAGFSMRQFPKAIWGSPGPLLLAPPGRPHQQVHSNRLVESVKRAFRVSEVRCEFKVLLFDEFLFQNADELNGGSAFQASLRGLLSL